MYLICSLFAHAESNSCSISSCYGFEVQMGYKMDINVKTICQVCFVAWQLKPSQRGFLSCGNPEN